MVEILAPMPAWPARKSVEITGETAASLKMVYHATGIHRHEHEFLMPIVQLGNAQAGNLHFEVFADGNLARRCGTSPGH